ncbi:hypothetical protein GA0115233_103846 [Streptomyces sp. DI166]|nr:hypothetical protein GA0115233_103846 [Streptomyces sp. DI166]
MPSLPPASNHGDMSAATINPVHGRHPATGATPVLGSHHHRLGDALRAVKVFARAALDVIVLGEYAEQAGVRRK